MWRRRRRGGLRERRGRVGGRRPGSLWRVLREKGRGSVGEGEICRNVWSVYHGNSNTVDQNIRQDLIEVEGSIERGWRKFWVEKSIT